jgi:hypothetical protein
MDMLVHSFIEMQMISGVISVVICCLQRETGGALALLREL